MAAQTTLTVSYELSLPQGTNCPSSLAPNGAHAFTIEADKTTNTGEYYKTLQKSIVVAKEKLGEELTAWRDAVGNAEAGKENAVKAARAEDEEDEEDQTL